MSNRRAPNAMNQEIIKAMEILTNQNRDVIVRLGDIVQVVQTQLKENPIDQKTYSDRMIKEAIYKIRDVGLIDHIGFNQYCCADCIVDVKNEPPEPPIPSNEKNVDPKYFRPTKSMTELKSRLDPGKNKPSTSSVSLSGSSIEKVRKRFNPKKVLKKPPSNPPLPGARQVPTKRHLTADSSDEVVAKKRKFEKYFEGEIRGQEVVLRIVGEKHLNPRKARKSTSEEDDDSIGSNLQVTIEVTRADYETSSEESIEA